MGLLTVNYLVAGNTVDFIDELCEIQPGYQDGYICTRDLKQYGYAVDPETNKCRLYSGPGLCFTEDFNLAPFTEAPFDTLEECQLTCESL